VSATLASEQTSAPLAGGAKKALHDKLTTAITESGKLLPISGPIGAFAFLNTLEALEDHPFDVGMRKGARLYGCQPYLAEEIYREHLTHGRIRVSDLSAVLKSDLGSRGEVCLAELTTRFDLRRVMLEHPLRCGPHEELRWFVAETDALTQMCPEVPAATRDRFVEETRRWVMRDVRKGNSGGHHGELHEPHLLADLIRRFGEPSIEAWDDAKWEAFSLQALWRIIQRGVGSMPAAVFAPHPKVRHRDILLEAGGEDSDLAVHDLLIRFCAAFTDQGMADWSLPHREQGFFQAFAALHQTTSGPTDRALSHLAQELDRLERHGLGPLDSILESLEFLGVTNEEWPEFIPATLLALRGWAGMLWQMEFRSDRVPLPVAPGTLAEFLAVRLILERLSLTYVARHSLDFDGPLSQLRKAARAKIDRHPSRTVAQRAFPVFQIAQVLGWTPETMYHLSLEEWRELVSEVESFSSIERRSMFHQAFERRYDILALDAITIHAQREPHRVEKALFQAVFCLDAREESFRRHIEEISPDVETFGAAGFFSVPMYYRGLSDAHFAALCPIVIRPQHWVVEDVVYTMSDAHHRRAKTRRALGAASHQVHVRSRGFAAGALLTGGLGVLASIPLVARVLFPRLTADIRRTASQFVRPPEITRLRLERTADPPGPEDEHIGFTVAEMATMGERLLRDIGLTSGFARLVMFFGHGSYCLNNPHKSAYDCGACTGNAGSPNARALAAILNDLRVREILATRGLQIPHDTVFLGGLHNTCEDTVSFLDLDLLPKSHFADFAAAQKTLEEACERNAHERCRRFESAPLNLSFAAARRHVQMRAEDLAQPRPEYGNASNAMCVVGRRTRTLGLYMDRRSFMHSYDATQDDDEGTILGRILSAVIPVCEGINMQYFLSSIDSQGWACGSKLPHNVTGLLGVMDGAASDLRPGLPWQGVEIHEPVRCLFVIESTPEVMTKIMDRIPVVGRILRNRWALLAVLDPQSAKIQLFEKGEFVPYEAESSVLPHAPSSFEWYRGWRKHLEFAEIGDVETSGRAVGAGYALSALAGAQVTDSIMTIDR